jgi:ribosome-associated protein
MFQITPNLAIADDEIELTAIRAQGAGGQNVNKVSAAIHLRFDIPSSSLPEPCKQRLLALPDRRVNERGIIVIKAQRFRAREQNVSDAMHRLRLLIRSALAEPRQRIPTRPGRAAGERRLESKTRRGRLKQTRAKVERPAD